MSGGGGGVGDNNNNKNEDDDNVDDYGGGVRACGKVNRTKPPDFGFKMNCSRGSWQLEKKELFCEMVDCTRGSMGTSNAIVKADTFVYHLGFYRS